MLSVNNHNEADKSASNDKDPVPEIPTAVGVGAPRVAPNRPYNIFIYGSCVSRDIFRIDPSGVRIVDYFARHSIPSTISKPYLIQNGDIKLDSEFQKKMIVRDFNKDIWTELKEKQYDCLLIDLIDERFNLIQIGDSLITHSAELMKSGLVKQLPTSLEIQRSKYGIDQWAKDCKVFCDRLLASVAMDKIVILECYWATRYVNRNGQETEFSEGTKFTSKILLEANSLLQTYYGILLANLPGVKVIHSPAPLASESHQWGLSPFHFVDDWYKACKLEIFNHLSNKNDKLTRFEITKP